jgi:hypothetical protein
MRADVDDWLWCSCAECGADRATAFAMLQRYLEEPDIDDCEKACAANPAARERDGNREGGRPRGPLPLNTISGALRWVKDWMRPTKQLPSHNAMAWAASNLKPRRALRK